MTIGLNILNTRRVERHRSNPAMKNINHATGVSYLKDAPSSIIRLNS